MKFLNKAKIKVGTPTTPEQTPQENPEEEFEFEEIEEDLDWEDLEFEEYEVGDEDDEEIIWNEPESHYEGDF